MCVWEGVLIPFNTFIYVKRSPLKWPLTHQTPNIDVKAFKTHTAPMWLEGAQQVPAARSSACRSPKCFSGSVLFTKKMWPHLQEMQGNDEIIFHQTQPAICHGNVQRSSEPKCEHGTLQALETHKGSRADRNYRLFRGTIFGSGSQFSSIWDIMYFSLLHWDDGNPSQSLKAPTRMRCWWTRKPGI